ncbi:MAG TPA: quinone oxidoreductase [Gemmatimonadales bacterium]|nr:quinone oxidoreductase [Gemmatimonadales bacterium]
MRAIVVHSLGAPDVLRTGHRPVPDPGPGEVLVRLRAIGVNFSDTERRRGVYDPPPLPWTPGNEAAGVVEAVGPGTDPVWHGRRVAFWAMRTSGCYAEYATVSASALFHLRDELDFPTGAALPAQGLTAYGLAYASTSLPAGATALVHAAAGGVGALLVQLLVRRGVRVFGTASAAKLPLVEAAGAAPMTYGRDLAERVRRATGGRGVDAVFDSVGRDTQEASLATLALYGRLVWFGDSSGPPDPVQPDALYRRNLQVTAFWLAADPPERWEDARRELQEWAASGALRVTIDRTYPLDQAAEAHRRLEARETRGKVILLPGD